MKYIFGIHSVESLLTHTPHRIKKILLDAKRHDRRLQTLVQLAQTKNILIEHVDKHTLESAVGAVTHQGVIAECVARTTLHESDLTEILQSLSVPPLLLILDEVQDPHNLGACLRSADAAGVHAVIVPKNNSAVITPIVEKVASGAAETVPFIQVTNLARTLRALKEMNIWIYGLTDKAADSIYQADLKRGVALVLGAEGSGLRSNTLNHCDVLYSIPMAGTVSSLNVSVAAGVCLFEAVRQRALSNHKA